MTNFGQIKGEKYLFVTRNDILKYYFVKTTLINTFNPLKIFYEKLS